MKHLFLSIYHLVFLVLTSVPISAFGQEIEDAFKKERRVFLWDVTISMVGATRNADCPNGTKRSKPDFDYAKSGFPNYNSDKDIFDVTRETLVKMIYQIENESTEIIVLPFRNGIVGEFRATASASGKEQIINDIMNWNNLQSGGTFTATCLKMAVNKYFTKDKINRLFLLTDGEPSNNEGAELLDYLEKWQGLKETKGSSCYLVYVMLTDEAEFYGIGEIAKESGGDITVVKDFEEPTWLAINHKASIHIRDYFNGKYSSGGNGEFKVPFTFLAGTKIPENSIFHFCIEDNDYIAIDPDAVIRTDNGRFIVPFSLKMSLEEYLSKLPSDTETIITAECVKDTACNKNISVTGSNLVNISLVLYREPRVSISLMKKQ